MIKIRPSAPLGRYPQPLLYGHAGTEPSNSRIRMIKSIVPIPHYLPIEFRLCFGLHSGVKRDGAKVIVFDVGVKQNSGRTCRGVTPWAPQIALAMRTRNLDQSNLTGVPTEWHPNNR
jgi:hypothetical protein